MRASRSRRTILFQQTCSTSTTRGHSSSRNTSGAAGSSFSEVAGGADADVLLGAHDPDPRVAGGVLRQDLAAVVGRAVVDRDELEVGERLLEHRVEALTQIALH